MPHLLFCRCLAAVFGMPSMLAQRAPGMGTGVTNCACALWRRQFRWACITLEVQCYVPGQKYMRADVQAFAFGDQKLFS